MLDQSRRRFIKGAAYTSSLTVTGLAGLSNLAMANEAITTQKSATEIVTLINHTSSFIQMDNISGVALSDLNDEKIVMLAPGEESSFIVPAMSSKNGSANNKNLFITDVLANNQLTIKSDYVEFNGIYSTKVFAHQAA